MGTNAGIAAVATLAWAAVLGCSASSAGNSDATRASGHGGSTVSSGAGGAAGHGASAVAGSSSSAGSSNAGAGSPGSGGVSGATGSGGGSAGWGTAGTAGTAGTVTSGGAGGSPGNPCSKRPGLLFCDDFESAALGTVTAAPWSVGLNGMGTVTVDSSVPAHSGTKSVHVHSDSFQTLLVYHDAAILPQASGKFYSRAWVRFGAPMTAGHNTFLIADTSATPGAGNATRIGEMNSMLMMTVGGDAHGYLSNQNYYNDGKIGVQFAAQAYTCLEMLFDSPGMTIDIWVNGKEVPDMHAMKLAYENYDALRFGFEQYSGPAADFWFDDIAIGTLPIGCD